MKPVKIASGVLMLLTVSLYTAPGMGDTTPATELEDGTMVCQKGSIAYGLGCDGACDRRTLYCKEQDINLESRTPLPNTFSKGRNKGYVDKSGYFVFATRESEDTFTLIFDKSMKLSSSDTCKTTRKEKCPNNTFLSGLKCDDKACLNPKLTCCHLKESNTVDEQQETESE